MLTDKNAEIYDRLWFINTTFVDPGIEVPVYVTYHRMAKREAYFALYDTTHDFKRPHIRIGRNPVPAQKTRPDFAGADVGELIALAHERGHEESWRRGEYVHGTMDEENRAWDYAEKLLRDHGFADWDEFEKAKRVSLAIHHQKGTR